LQQDFHYVPRKKSDYRYLKLLDELEQRKNNDRKKASVMQRKNPCRAGTKRHRLRGATGVQARPRPKRGQPQPLDDTGIKPRWTPRNRTEPH
jgi:hypothetical protein